MKEDQMEPSEKSLTRYVVSTTQECLPDTGERGTKLGTVVENIIPVSPCPVVLYRPGESTTVSRI
jgi:hypothetical protein